MNTVQQKYSFLKNRFRVALCGMVFMVTVFAAPLSFAGLIPEPKPPSVGCAVCEAAHDGFHAGTRDHITQGFLAHQTWLVDVFFEEYILPAYMAMTEQLTVAMMQQTNMIGQFLDAKHQLETQRLFQELQAQAHKDYHPSEGLCQIGTNVRSLASSDRSTEFNTVVISNRTMQRQLVAGDVLSLNGESSDRTSRLEQFKNTYCNPLDNAMGLELLCGGGGPANRQNKDIDFTRTFESPMTLELDFTAEGAGPPTPDEEDVFALAAYLYGHKTPSQIPESFLTDAEGDQLEQATSAFLGMRSVIAKRSVAQNSFASILAQKSQGAPEVQPFMFAMLQDFGLPDAEITEMLGERPSYYAQMEMLGKKMYQHPNFYTNLYDKPVNVQRKQVAMQAIELMQKRDMFRSLLRSEMALSVLLETAIDEEQQNYRNEVDQLGQIGVTNPGGE